MRQNEARDAVLRATGFLYFIFTQNHFHNNLISKKREK